MSIFKLKLLCSFYRELATMIRSNLGVVEAVDTLSEHFGQARIAGVAKDIKQRLAGGSTLSDALSGQDDLFARWQIDIVKYSELAGRLAEGLERICAQLDKDYDVQKKIILALAYPAVLLHIAIFGLPLASLFIGNPSDYFTQVLKIIVPLYGIIFLSRFLRGLIVKSGAKNFYDRFMLGIPLFGNLFRQFALVRFVRALKCLFESGVSIVQAWRTAAQSCPNDFLRAALLRGTPVIEKGGSLTQAFVITGVFSAKTTGMLASGEKSGSIDKMLESIAIYSEKESDMMVGILLVTLPVLIYLMVAGYIAMRVIVFYTNYFNQVFSPLN